MPSYMNDLIEEIKKKKSLLEEQEKQQEKKETKQGKAQEPTEQKTQEKTQKKTTEKKQEVQEPVKMPVQETMQEDMQLEQEKLQEKFKGGKQIDSYGQTQVFKVPNEPLLSYVIPVPRPTEAEKSIINTIKEAATRLITIAPYRIRDQQERRNVYYQKVIEILQNSPQLKIPQRRWNFYAESVVKDMVGYGLIDSLVEDDQIEEIMVNGPKKPVYVFHRKYEMMTTNIEFFSDQEIVDLINRIARQVGRRVDISSPMLDARLSDGSRVNATIQPAAVDGSTLTIRKFKKDPYTIINLIKNNTIDSYTAAFLWTCSEGMSIKPANILISGGTGSGKTTTLNALAAFIPPYERVISIEDTAELNLPLKHWIRLEGRPPSLEGKGEITLDILTKNSLRMRPDRIIVGEIRHSEAFTLFTAINTGHEGALTGDTLIQLSDGNILPIEKIVQDQFMQKPTIKEGKFEFTETCDEIFVPSLNKQTLKIEHKKITHVWRKHNQEKIIKIKLKSGKKIKLTKSHPVYRINEGIQEISAHEANKGDFIALPKEIPITSTEKQKTKKARLIFASTNLRASSTQQLIQIFNGTTYEKENGKLQLLAESDLLFEEIIEKSEETINAPVYDLTVEDNHNYIANGLIVSNCMGTIHANSSLETVVRVISPPMSVPEIMLSSLDFILVQHRLHDKKKGTIRRVTEISEVTNVLEGKTKTLPIFEYDHASDQLKRTSKTSNFLKTIADYTGKTIDFVEKNILKREKFLKELLEKETMSINEVSKQCQEYLKTEK